MKRPREGDIRALGDARGFTLIELCVVVSVIAILTSMATANYAVYVSRAKAAEATVNVETLAYLEQARILDTGRPIACAPEPRDIPKNGALVSFDAGACWRDLGFRPTARVRFQYSTDVPEGRRFVVTARGDLDGDGTPSEYSIDSRTMSMNRRNPD